jgi:N4-gp56 family major capsid protein
MAVGTGTPGSNQNGAHPTGPAHSPGEVLSVSGPLSINANVPVVDKDFADMFVTTAYDLAVRDAQRPNLILDQFATEEPSNLTHNGATKRVFFLDDIPEAAGTTPLLENIDVDSVALTGRSLDLTQREYGTTVARTNLLRAQTMVPFDPIAARKVGWHAGRSQDALARTAFTAATLAMKDPDGTAITGTIGTLIPTISGGSAGYVSTDVIQEGTVLLQEANAEPFMEDSFVLVCGPRAVQHLRAENGTSGWRDVVMRNEGASGNSIMRGYVGTYEGVKVVVSRNMTAGTALLFGAEAFSKVYPDIDGFGAYPSAVVAPVTDSLRRFAKIGWYWLGGYSIFRPQNVIKITHATTARAFGATNTALGATAYAEA